ncbi:hypothetical protein [Halorientalis halophila]|uniref:hypothetical protein n=1 Tax=Halorientalis halophila TaxID=3108499 RepID=UPI003009142E
MVRKLLPVLLLVGLAVLAGCSFLGPNPDSYASSYEYSVGIDSNATLQNATLRVPLPQVDGATPINASVVAPNGSIEGNFAATVVETDHGRMLELVTDELPVRTRYYRVVESGDMGRREEISESAYDPSNPDHQKVTQRTVGVSVSVAADYPLETQSPFGTEPTFYADDAVSRTPSECSLPYRNESGCFAYDAPMYMSYDAPANASVSGIVTFGGYNEWFTGGWTGNEYTDRATFRATGPQDGWVTGDGYTETGRGNYPSPER